jgi:hypothetical protein
MGEVAERCGVDAAAEVRCVGNPRVVAGRRALTNHVRRASFYQ